MACLLFMPCGVAWGQSSYDVTYGFQTDTVQIEGVQTFTNRLTVKNTTNRSVTLLRDTALVIKSRALIDLPESIALAPQQTRSFPVKFLADRVSITAQNEVFLVGWRAQDADVRVQPRASFSVYLHQERALLLTSDQSEYYIDPSTQQAQFMIRVVNKSLAPIDFRLEVASAHQEIELTGEMLPIHLEAGGQELLPFSATLRSRAQRADATVLLRAKDEDGRVLATRRIRVMTVGSVQHFGSGVYPREYGLNNQLALRYVSMNHYQSIYQLQGHGALDLQKGRTLDYRLNFDYYRDFNAMNLYNTYVDYQEDRWGVKLGNIYENLDYAISGRGVKASYKLPGNRSFHVYGVDNNYMLVSQLTSPIPGGKIIAGAYEFGEDLSRQGRVSYLHNQNDYRGIRTHQASGVTPISLGDEQSLDIEGGYSLEQTLRGTTKHAVAAGAHYDYRFGDYFLAANGYYSSPYYTGLRRGVFQTDARLIKSINAHRSISARVSVMDNNPKYQEGERVQYVTNRRGVQIYELGYRDQIGVFYLDVRPYLMFQNLEVPGNYFHLFAGRSWRSDALRTVLDLSYFNAVHRFSLKTDYGWAYRHLEDNVRSQYHSLRMNGHYRHRLLGFQGYLQINPYYLSDVLSAGREKDNYLYSFGPNTNFQLFDGRMNVRLSGMYNYYGFSRTRNVSVNAEVDWQLRDNWRISGSLHYAFMRSRTPYVHQTVTQNMFHRFNNRQIRVGIEKQFSGMNAAKGHRLDLRFFDDANNNGVYDRGEQVLEGIVAKIDRQIARSDHRGRVRFRDMATESYQVLTEAQDGWSSLGSVRVVMSENTQLDIPMVKTSSLRGRIKPVNTRYLASSAPLGGIPVMAVAQNGRTFKTLSDGSGQFAFYLPPGDYTVSVKSEGLPFTIANGSQNVEVKAEENQVLGDFQYVDQRRKVDVKRF